MSSGGSHHSSSTEQESGGTESSGCDSQEHWQRERNRRKVRRWRRTSGNRNREREMRRRREEAQEANEQLPPEPPLVAQGIAAQIAAGIAEKHVKQFKLTDCPFCESAVDESERRLCCGSGRRIISRHQDGPLPLWPAEFWDLLNSDETMDGL